MPRINNNAVCYILQDKVSHQVKKKLSHVVQNIINVSESASLIKKSPNSLQQNRGDISDKKNKTHEPGSSKLSNQKKYATISAKGCNPNGYFNELKERLFSRRNSSEDINLILEDHFKPTWFQELIKSKVTYAQAKTERIALEKKEEIRIDMALAAEKKEKEKIALAEQAEAEKISMIIANTKRDEKGIPIPPPPPPLTNTTSSWQEKRSADPKATSRSKDASVSKERQNAVIEELKLKLNKRSFAPPVFSGKGLKPWQHDLVKAVKRHEETRPEREAAEKKEEARVANAFAAEAAEKEKKAAAEKAEAERISQVVANTKRDDNGIPLPPPLPG